MLAFNHNAVLSQDTGSLEDYLSNTLGMVDPDPNFVGHLQWRLTHKPEVEIESSHYLGAILIICAGLFSGACMFWLLSQVFKGMRSINHSD